MDFFSVIISLSVLLLVHLNKYFILSSNLTEFFFLLSHISLSDEIYFRLSNIVLIHQLLRTSFTLFRHPIVFLRVSHFVNLLPIPNSSQQDVSTCSSHEFFFFRSFGLLHPRLVLLKSVRRAVSYFREVHHIHI